MLINCARCLSSPNARVSAPLPLPSLPPTAGRLCPPPPELPRRAASRCMLLPWPSSPRAAPRADCTRGWLPAAPGRRLATPPGWMMVSYRSTSSNVLPSNAQGPPLHARIPRLRRDAAAARHRSLPPLLELPKGKGSCASLPLAHPTGGRAGQQRAGRSSRSGGRSNRGSGHVRATAPRAVAPSPVQPSRALPTGLGFPRLC